MNSNLHTSLSTRREWLGRLGKTILISPLLGAGMLSICCGEARRSETSGLQELSDDAFLDESERAAFLYFWEQASATTGQGKDGAHAGGMDSHTVASIAATGFG